MEAAKRPFEASRLQQGLGLRALLAANHAINNNSMNPSTQQGQQQSPTPKPMVTPAPPPSLSLSHTHAHTIENTYIRTNIDTTRWAHWQQWQGPQQSRCPCRGLQLQVGQQPSQYTAASQPPSTGHSTEPKCRVPPETKSHAHGSLKGGDRANLCDAAVAGS